MPRFQNPSSIMIWGAFSKRGKFPLVFIDKGVKIGVEVYKKDILKNVILPNLKTMFGDEYYCYQ